jgi:hypothetical protein
MEADARGEAFTCLHYAATCGPRCARLGSPNFGPTLFCTIRTHGINVQPPNENLPAAHGPDRPIELLL